MKESIKFGELFGGVWEIFKSKFVLLVSLVFVLSFVPNLIYYLWINGQKDIYAESVVGVYTNI